MIVVENVIAQDNWPPETYIPEYNDRRPPLLVADDYGVVHAFNTETIDEQGNNAIFYRQWTKTGGWSSPVDILLPPELGVNSVRDVYVGEDDNLHLIFFAGIPPDTGNIYYTTAPVTDAYGAQAWDQPEIIGPEAGPLTQAALEGEDNGRLLVVYAGKREGNGLYEVHSTDFGKSWSKPSPFFILQEGSSWATNIRTALDDEGMLHVVWSVTNERALGEKIYYANFNSDMVTWSIPKLLATRTEDEYSTNWASIIYHEGELFVFYMDGGPPTRYMRRSSDGGKTWSEPVRPFPEQGEYEQAVFLVDSNNVLHLVLGNRTADPEIHGMWHSVWDGEQWSPLEPIVSGPLTSQFDPSAPRAVISQGNVMLVTWWHNATGIDVPGYSFTTLDSPAIPTKPVKTPTTIAEAEAIEINTPIPTNTVINTEGIINSSTDDGNSVILETNPIQPIFIGILAVILFGAIMVFTLIVRRQY